MMKDTNVMIFPVVCCPSPKLRHTVLLTYTRSAYVSSSAVSDYCKLILFLLVYAFLLLIAIVMTLCSVTPGRFLSRPCTFPFPLGKNEDIFKRRVGMLYRTVNPSPRP